MAKAKVENIERPAVKPPATVAEARARQAAKRSPEQAAAYERASRLQAAIQAGIKPPTSGCFGGPGSKGRAK